MSFRDWPGVLRSVIRRQCKHLKSLLAGDAVVTTPLVAMTLEPEDLSIARRWRRDRAAWRDEAVVAAYHDRFSAWNASRHAFSFMSGREALSACIHALDLKPGDEVIVPGYTCVVVPNAFRFARVEPVFCDIELDTFGPDVDSVAGRITSRTKAILVHHLYGLVCRDLEALIEIARDRNLFVIEDCAPATGASYKGTKVGNFGDVAFYSSEVSKVFDTVVGGVAVTNDDALAARLDEYHAAAPYPADEEVERLLRNVPYLYYAFKHPLRWLLVDVVERRYGKDVLPSTPESQVRGERPAGYGRRMPPPMAALAVNQLDKIDRFNRERREGAKYWERWCRSNGYRPPLVVEGSTPAFLRYPVMVEEDKKRNPEWAQKELGVDLGVWFVSNLHPAEGVLPECANANQAVARCVNFPTILNRKPRVP